MEPHEIPNCTPEGDHFRGPIRLKYGNNSIDSHFLVTEIDSHFLVTESPHRGRRTLGARIAPTTIVVRNRMNYLSRWLARLWLKIQLVSVTR
jgi:hypothetical protein